MFRTKGLQQTVKCFVVDHQSLHMTGRHSRLRAAFQASVMTIWPRADFPTLRPTFVTSSLGPVSLEVSYLKELRPLSHLSHQGSKWEAAYLANFPKAVYL